MKCGFLLQGRTTCPAPDSANSGRLDITEVVSQQYQDKQGYRSADARCQCSDGAIALAFVSHQIKEGRSKASQNQDKGDGNENFHARAW